ncbi:hypothetical protein LPB72_18170 [Hydrogenophaga crassostreae]|uniref:Uncharacterized protein n=1 Tax=Hydrogenophaga crassostreae TaxID=1763535 RepID=A0A167H092_9BURK|nr:hypothetical protein [Hydrogenophaga crassostreae]AOW12905.1 hypothetical protein LPB072_08675 [Hydrogenophaga crassostreae]OAD40090.1 hypothetical protein LPB72_18170 [Hydrogenophaga crassostreae]
MTDHLSAFCPGDESGDVSLPADWQDRLVARLGKRPRRIGLWAELALFGARQCLDANGIDRLSPHAVLRLSSTHGPVGAMALVGSSCEEGLLPMPFDFLQSQPSQMLAALSQYLQWRGDASFVAWEGWGPMMAQMPVEAAVLRQRAELAQQPFDGMLVGRVDLGPVPRSQWQWMA